MFFLLRMAFWLGLVLILLPSGSSQEPVGSRSALPKRFRLHPQPSATLRGFARVSPTLARSVPTSLPRSATGLRPAPRCFTSS